MMAKVLGTSGVGSPKVARAKGVELAILIIFSRCLGNFSGPGRVRPVPGLALRQVEGLLRFVDKTLHQYQRLRFGGEDGVFFNSVGFWASPSSGDAPTGHKE